jgi:hypothetical protein
MPLYVVESYNKTIEHGGHEPYGVTGIGGGSERVYLYVISVTDAELARLRPRVDEDGNKQHDRLALPDRFDWWIAIDGEKVWPGTVSPKIRSRCSLDENGVPTPVPLDAEERAQLERLKAKLPG